jgi:hypothetical protein
MHLSLGLKFHLPSQRHNVMTGSALIANQNVIRGEPLRTGLQRLLSVKIYLQHMHLPTFWARELYHGAGRLTYRKLNWLCARSPTSGRSLWDRKYAGETCNLNLLVKGKP